MSVGTIILKDIRKIFKDKKILMVILVMPIIIMTILGFSLNSMFTGTDSGVSKFQIGLVSEYELEDEMKHAKNSLSVFQPLSDVEALMNDINPEKIFKEDFLGSQGIKDILITKEYSSLVAAKEALDNQEIYGIIVLPKDFVYNTYMNLAGIGRTKTEIGYITGTQDSFYGMVIEVVINSYVEMMNQIVNEKNVTMEVLASYLDLNQAIESMSKVMENRSDISDSSISFNEKVVEKENLISGFQYYAVAIMSMFLFYGASVTIRLMLEEKNEMTLQRLIVSGVSLNKVILANYFTTMAIIIVQSVILIVYSSLALGVKWGNPIQIFLVMIVAAFAVGGMASFFGLLTYYNGKFGIANIYEFVFINAMSLIGGSFLPIYIMPKLMQQMAVISVNGNCIQMYTGIMLGRNLSEYGKELMALIIMGIGFGFLSLLIKITHKEAI